MLTLPALVALLLQVRAELGMPQPGELPLPAGLTPAQRDFAPTWEQLPFPAGAHPPPPAPHPQAVLKFKGGESSALARLKYYIWDSGLISTYFDTRNGMLGGDYSTKFAPWLAHGCLSPRTIYHAIKAYESKKGGNKSTYW